MRDKVSSAFWILGIALIIWFGAHAVYYMLPPKIYVAGMTVSTFGQADPEIHEYMDPIVNVGFDVNRVTLNQWIDKGNDPRLWRPIHSGRLRPGDEFFTLRDVEFMNKVQDDDATALVAYVGCSDSGAWYREDPFPVPTRTIGRVVRNFRATIPIRLQPGCWKRQVSVKFFKNMLFPKVHATFRDVIIEVIGE